MFAVRPAAVMVKVHALIQVDCTQLIPPAPYAAVYFTESAKYASSAVTRFRRSDFIEAMYAFAFVLANFGIAMAARSEERRVGKESRVRGKPFRFTKQYSGGSRYHKKRVKRMQRD